MINVVLFRPEIPPNTGNIMRLCANIGAKLHLIKPYGFDLTEKSLRRAGLDYKHLMITNEYDNFADFLAKTKVTNQCLFCATTKTKTLYSEVNYQLDDYLLFGSETKGLPAKIREKYFCITLPMVANSRSINLSNAVAIITYEAWRQLNFIYQ